ncbi:MAG: heavy metal translocating P-type ATPase [Bacteroidetes bacterium]|nr:heavy metal translocating P-type ATPase [Bacteroidota bacterium]
MEESKKINLPVMGMSCANCALKVEKFLNQQSGVENARVNFASKEVLIDYAELDLSELASNVKDFGYEFILPDQLDSISEKEEERFKTLKLKLIIAVLCTLPVFVLSMIFPKLLPYPNWIMLIFSIPVVFWSGSEFFINAWNQLKHFSANMDTLVAIGTGSAFIYSLINTLIPEFSSADGTNVHVYYESATVIITFILLGRFWEEKAKVKAASAIKKLMGLQPKDLTVIRNDEELSIPIHAVLKNDIVLIKPGEQIPVDGIVKKGSSYIDESMISGEPIPVFKEKGKQVFTGTINQDSVLQIQAERIGSETLLQQIIKLVKEAQSTKPPIQKLADKIASVFVPIVLIIGILTFVAWYIYGPEPLLTNSLIRFISVMIIACPCALGLATPTALMVGMGKAAQNGIVIKDSQGLEQAKKTDILAFDKTGTITIGKPEVINTEWLSEEDEVKQILFSLEEHSTHPLASAVLNHLGNIKTLELSSFENLSGKGIKAVYEGTVYFAGNKSLIEQYAIKIDKELQKKIIEWEEMAYTIVYFGSETELISIIAIADKIREESSSTIAELKSLGIQTMMLTGDHEKAAKKISEEAGIDTHFAGLLPHQKVEKIKELQSQGKHITMVGDGINDSAALAQADLGIALASGSDIAMESAGITLINPDLKQVISALRLSKATVKTIHQNLFWAFIYNIIALPIAAGLLFPINGFLLNPMVAGAAMALSSVSVVTNSLRLRNIKL